MVSDKLGYYNATDVDFSTNSFLAVVNSNTVVHV